MAWTSYRDLMVWQKAMDLTDEVYRLVKILPKEELYGLSDQLRRAAVSIPSNIAEGHGRKNDKEFCNFLSMANGSCMEVETQLYICVRQRFISQTDISKALSLINETSKMLTSLIFKIQNRLKEQKTK